MCKCVDFKCSTISSGVSETLKMMLSNYKIHLAKATRQREARRGGIKYTYLLQNNTQNFRYHVISKCRIAVECSLTEFTNKLRTQEGSTSYLTLRWFGAIRSFGSTFGHSGKQRQVYYKIVYTFGFSQFYIMQENGYQFATICSSNVNRSMEAHSLFQVRQIGHACFQKNHLRVCSYGTGRKIKIPGLTEKKPLEQWQFRF